MMSPNKSVYEEVARVGEWAKRILIGGLAAVITFAVTGVLDSPVAITVIGLAAAALTVVSVRVSSRDQDPEDQGVRSRLAENLAVAGALAAVVSFLQLIRFFV